MAEAADLKDSVYSHLFLTQDSTQISIKGHFYPTATTRYQANSLNYQVSLNNYPFEVLQYLVNNGISNTVGRVDGLVVVEGPLNNPNTNGYLRLKKAGVTVDYLKTRLLVKDETVTISNSRFQTAPGASIYDTIGNRAFITGGLIHDHFREFGLDVSIKGDNFLFLNTTKEDNPLYYGKAIGEGEVTFSGDFKQTDIKIRATTHKGTKVTFPFARDQSASAADFIHFTDKKSNTGKATGDTILSKRNYFTELRGVNLEMDLNVTTDAETDLLFDPATRDNIRSYGDGAFHVAIDRTGELRMYGEYRIEKGEYLFTLIGLVNKNFVLQRDGTIRWTGNPFEAIINIDADYKGLVTPPYNFIAGYIENDENSRSESNRPTAVDLTLHLDGALLKPDISFDIAFPKLTGVLKNYVENKLGALRQDQNELNRQVSGLVVLGVFLPSDGSLFATRDLAAGGVNTVAEFASSNLSSFFTKQLSEFVTGVDVQVGFNQVQQYDISNINKSSSYQQYRIRLSADVLKGRATISGGVAAETGTLSATSTSDVFYGYDANVDYYLTPDHRLKIRISTIHDQILDGRIRDKPAIGIRYREEFDSFGELFKKKKKKE